MVKRQFCTIMAIGLLAALTACNEVRQENPTCAKGMEHKLANHNSLLKKTGDGTLRVIVTLATDRVSMERKKDRMQYIKMVQDRFIQWLSNNKAKIDGRMKHTPQLFLTVDQKLLQALYKNEDVCMIHEDEPQQLIQ